VVITLSFYDFGWISVFLVRDTDEHGLAGYLEKKVSWISEILLKAMSCILEFLLPGWANESANFLIRIYP
jgi:hypothetical protein